MDKKSTNDVLTNINVAVQGVLTRKVISDLKNQVNDIRQEAISRDENLRKKQIEDTKTKAKNRALADINPTDMLPLEFEFRFFKFPDEAEYCLCRSDATTAYFPDAFSDDITEELKDKLYLNPKGEGKYFAWDAQFSVCLGKEEVRLVVQQKDAWLIAKGRDPERVKRQRKLRMEEAEREKRCEEAKELARRDIEIKQEEHREIAKLFPVLGVIGLLLYLLAAFSIYSGGALPKFVTGLGLILMAVGFIGGWIYGIFYK